MLPPGAQAAGMTIDRIPYHPGEGHLCGQSPLHHALGQDGLGRKGRVGCQPYRLQPGWGVGSGALQIEFPIQQGVATGPRIGQEDSHLTVGHLTGGVAVLPGHPGRTLRVPDVLFQELRFLHDEDSLRIP